MLGLEPRRRWMVIDVKPVGECWCGCGDETSRGAFFVSGHDKRGESAVVKVLYKTVPDFMAEHGFGPGGRNASAELEAFRRGGGAYL
jgi:hypothetical protein